MYDIFVGSLDGSVVRVSPDGAERIPPDNPEPKYRRELKRVGVDLDGTLAEPVWTPENPTDEIGEPIWLNVRKLWELHDAGYRIYIYTSRPDYQVEIIERWLKRWAIPYRDVRTGKPLYAAYIDDRAIHSEAESWLPR